MPTVSDPETTVRAGLEEHLATTRRVQAELVPAIVELAADVVASLSAGGTLLAFGNGGSAADAQHLAAELVGRFRSDRRPLPAAALTTDTSVLTAIANDFGYDDVFARQLEALCRPGDIVVAISTSGDAESVVRAAGTARSIGARTWALTGGDGGRLAQEAEHAIVVPATSTARIQEMHGVVVHLVSAVVDDWAAGR